jgi:hypothetical protein
MNTSKGGEEGINKISIERKIFDVRQSLPKAAFLSMFFNELLSGNFCSGPLNALGTKHVL